MADDRAKPNKLNLSVDLRILSAILLVAIIAMLLIWRPWNTDNASARTVQINGEATVSAEPDEFNFSPTYEFKNADKDAALSELTKKSDELVAKLKELGVPESKIKTQSHGFDYPIFIERDGSNESTYNLTVSVAAESREQAQKVQDYLVTTTPQGSVSPLPAFSETKRKELESRARDEAAKDARSKAEQTAKNLGFKVGKVKELKENAGFGGPIPLEVGTMAVDSRSAASKPSLGVTPGENKLSYTVSVTYYIN